MVYSDHSENKAIIKKAVIRLLLVFLLVITASQDSTADSLKKKWIKDADGIEVAAGEYQRIITLAPNLAEICLALGLKDRLAAVSKFSDYPGLENVPRTDGWRINYEAVVLLKPDLVLSTSAGNPHPAIERLRELGLNVFHTEQPSLAGIFETIGKIGALTGRTDKAKKVVKEMQSDLQLYKETTLMNRRTRPRVLYIIWAKPLMAPGGGTFLSELINLAGGENIFASSSERIIKPSLEKIIELDPEIIFLPQQVTEDDLDSRWNSISAIKYRRVYRINEDYVLRPGINVIKGIKELGKKILPASKWKDRAE